MASVREIRFDPGEGSAGNAEGGLEAGDEDEVVDSVKSGAEAKEDEDGGKQSFWVFAA